MQKKQNPDRLIAMSIRWPKYVVDMLDRRRGAYITRNKFLLKLVTERLTDNEDCNKKGGPGAHRLPTQTPKAET